MQIPVQKLTETAIIPTKSHYSDAGFDLYADQDITIGMPKSCLLTGLVIGNNHAIVKTGIALAIPEGYAGLIWDRSGIGAKHGVHRFAGVIDSGYRGEIMVSLHNFGILPFEIKKGDRIAQILIQEIPSVSLVETDDLSDSDRGDKGFGSTGK